MFKNIITKLIVTVLLVLPLLMPFETAKAAPSLTLQKSANKTQVEPGGTITYTIIATNSGTSEAQNVRIEDPINPDLLNADTIQFIGPAGTYDRSARKIIWTILPNISAGGSLTLSFSIQQGQTPTGIPAAPTGLIAVAAASDQINIAWQDNSSNETGFRIERSLSSDSGFSLIRTGLPNQPFYSDVFLNPSTTYYYRVAAFNDAGSSGYSNVASATTEPGGPLTPSGTAMDVVTDGNTYAYVATNERGLVVIDIRNALQPAVLGSTQAIGFRPIRVARQGNIVAVAGGRYGASFVDVSNPALPQVQSNVPYRAVDIALEGQYAYLIDDLSARLRIIDLSNPASPVLRSDFTLTGTPLSLSVLNGYVYVSNSSALLEVDARTPASPTISRALNVPNQRVATKPGWAYIDGLPYGGIQTVDLNSWSVVGQHQTGCSLYRYVVEGNMIYAAYREFWGSASGIRIMNVADPAAPFSTGAKRTDGEAYGIAASGNYAYLADGGPGLQIFNVQDPTRPTLVSTIR